MNTKPTILHITYDYAAENIGNSTVVIKDLIEASSIYLEHKIVALKRVTKFKLTTGTKLNRNILRVEHFGFPYGLFLKNNSYRISDKIIKRFNDFLDFDSIDAIHSHKLTFEGFVGYRLSKIFKKKLIFSIRQTDFLVLKYRPDLIPLVKQILTDAKIIFYIAPYMVNKLKSILSDNFINSILHKFHFLPNPIDFKLFEVKDVPKENYYVSILWLNDRSVKRKNLLGLLKAIRLINNKELRLKIIGKGNYERKVRFWINKMELNNQVELLGFKENSEIKDYLIKSKGLLLPSFSETFGVVYGEALISGTPILYSKGTGFDGIFENVGAVVDPYSIESIAEGINYIEHNNSYLHKEIGKLRENGAFEIFKKENVAYKYYEVLRDIL